MDAKTPAFIGLGVMGFPMAGHLARAGHLVTVYNRTPAKAAQWIEKYGGYISPSAAAAAGEHDSHKLQIVLHGEFNRTSLPRYAVPALLDRGGRVQRLHPRPQA